MLHAATSVYNEAIAASLHESPSRILDGKKIGHVIVNLTHPASGESLAIYPVTTEPENGDNGFRWRKGDLEDKHAARVLWSESPFDSLAPSIMAVIYRAADAHGVMRDEYTNRTLLQSVAGLAKTVKLLGAATKAMDDHEWKPLAYGSLGLGEMEVDFDFAHFPELVVTGHEPDYLLREHEAALTARLALERNRQIDGNPRTAAEIRMIMKAIAVTQRRLRSDNKIVTASAGAYSPDFDPAS